MALSPVTNTIGKAHLRLHGTTRQQMPAGHMNLSLSFSNNRVGHRIAQRRGLVVVDERRAARTISSTAFDCEFCIAQKDSAQHLTSEHHGSQHTYHKHVVVLAPSVCQRFSLRDPADAFDIGELL